MTLTMTTQALLDGWRNAASTVVEAVQGDGRADWQAARDAYADRLQTLLPAPNGVTFADVDLGGVPTLLVTPDKIGNDRVLFYMHGGGYVHSAPRAYPGLAGHFARKLRAVVYIPDIGKRPSTRSRHRLSIPSTPIVRLSRPGTIPRALRCPAIPQVVRWL